MSKKISVTVPEEFHDELTEYAKHMGHWSLSQLLKHTAVQYMRRYPKQAENGTEKQTTSK